MKKIIFLMLLIPFGAIAQETGIHFEHELNWEQIKAKAKKENKLIFMDCFTTWCGPCRYMTANIFPKKEVGTYFNEHFISIKVQLDTTENDNDQVKSWFKTGAEIAGKYSVKAYPTYLFFDAEGEAVHRAVGSSEAEAFIKKAEEAVDPVRQYYTMLARYKKGEKSPSFLLALSRAAQESYDNDNKLKISEEYLSTQKDLLTKENIEFLYDFTENSSDKGFKLMMDNEAAFDAIYGKGKARQKIIDIIKYNEIFPKAFNDNGELPNWKIIMTDISEKYPAYASESISGAKVAFYQNLGDWENFQSEIAAYLKNYGANLNAQTLNDYAWTVFQNCSDIKCIEQALQWSKRVIESENNPGYIDTYANILYRLGRVEEAIQWETNAMNLAKDSDKKGYQEVIDKMKAGDKTWN